MFETQLDILRAIYRYYPVGAMNLKDYYEGFNILRNMIESKIKSVKEATIVSLQMEKHFKHAVPEVTTYNCDYFQFPSFHFVFNFETKELEELIIRKSYVLNISLLTDYYTTFVREEYFPEKNKEDFGSYIVDSERGIGFSLGLLDKLNNEIRKMIEVYFPQKKSINHVVLKEFNITGVYPYNEDPSYFIHKKEYSAYELLFLGERDCFDKVVI